MKYFNRKQFGKFVLFALCFSALFSLITGCDDGGGITVPSGTTNMSVSAKNSNINNPTGIVITEAKALMSNMEFVNGSGQNEEIPVSPFVVDFSLSGNLTEMTSGYIIRDNYSQIKFLLHKPESTETPADPEFKTGTLDNQRFSFIIKGTYNGTSFVYRSTQELSIVISFSAVQNVNLANMNFSVLFDMSSWFKNGTAVMDPSNVNNAVLIDNNIKNSFTQAFMDNNKDGNPDN